MVSRFTQASFLLLVLFPRLILTAGGYNHERLLEKSFRLVASQQNARKRFKMEHDFAKRGPTVRSFLFKKVLSFDPSEDVALYILLDQPQKLGGLDFTPYFSHCPINDLALGTIVRALAKENPHSMPHYMSVYLARKHGGSQAVEIMASTSFRQLLRGISTGKFNREAMLRLQRLSNSPSWTNHQTGLLTLSQLSRLHAALQAALSKKR